MCSQPTVAHVKRTFLTATETFIGNQVCSLKRYRSVVLCHHPIAETAFRPTALHAATKLIGRPSLLAERVGYGAMPRPTPAVIAALADCAAAEAAQLLHMHYLTDARYFIDLKRRLNLPAVVSVYGYDVSRFPKRLGGFGARYLRPIWSEMDLFIAMSEDMKIDLMSLGCPEERIVVHFYGTPTARFAYPQRDYSQPEVVQILACGTLERKKAQHLVLEALHLANEADPALPRFHLTLIGQGPMREALASQVAGYGWQDRVTFAGHVPHHDARLVEAYRRADIFTLPSQTLPNGDKEGIPTVLAEAMAAGLPCLTTYHAGIPELVVPDHCGLLVEEGDTAGLAQAFSRLICDSTLRERLGRNAAGSVQQNAELSARSANLERIYDLVRVG
ncbi:glycosyltransferase [Mycobacterium sp. NPDC048908]|uniref:glycosyltransferase n=1 Tax=Mycobacterium sp. NPDC048908 TaxID=3364292 RepID=UPI0037151E67